MAFGVFPIENGDRWEGTVEQCWIAESVDVQSYPVDDYRAIDASISLPNRHLGVPVPMLNPEGSARWGMPDRPNVLFLMDDEHRPDVLGYAGDEVVRTPRLDWLAETGTVFTNAYTPAPVCVPARHSIRTGQLPRTWDRAGFENFEEKYRTLARHLGDHGYMTASAGKEHYHGENQMQGWHVRIGSTPVKWETGVFTRGIPDEYARFTDWKWSIAKEIKRAGVGDSRLQFQDRYSVKGVELFAEQFFSDPYWDRVQPDRPLFLKASLNQPHYPFLTDEEELFTYYLNRVEPYVETPEDFHPVLSHGDRVRPGEDVTEREIRRATAAYYAMLERVDQLFGRVLDALEHHGENLDEWVIVFAADHGELLGERGLWQKSKFYEASVRVPLVVRYPERFEPRTVDANVTLCDLFATLCDLAEVPIPQDVDSRSLVPLMAGKADRLPDDEAVSQNVSNQALLQEIETEQLMVKRGDLKYQYYGEGGPEVLFDLEQDPGETTNLIDEPAYADDVKRFRERRSELGYGPNADPDYETAGYW